MPVRLRVFVLSILIIWASRVAPQTASGQGFEGTTLEQRQPLELVFADSIVPQDHHETMLTTGAWYLRHGLVHDSMLTQKIEWGVSDRLQVSTFAQPLRHSNAMGSPETGVGDVEVGMRYTWVNAGSTFSHVALAADAGFPSGNPHTGLGDGAYSLSPSVLVSRELQKGRYQIFSTTGFDFVVARRRLSSADDIPHHEFFANSGGSIRAGHGWMVVELSVSTNRWAGGDETQTHLTPSYVWRLARRSELLLGIPAGLTVRKDRIGGLVKFTFELGGGER